MLLVLSTDSNRHVAVDDAADDKPVAVDGGAVEVAGTGLLHRSWPLRHDCCCCTRH